MSLVASLYILGVNGTLLEYVCGAAPLGLTITVPAILHRPISYLNTASDYVGHIRSLPCTYFDNS